MKERKSEHINRRIRRALSHNFPYAKSVRTHIMASTNYDSIVCSRLHWLLHQHFERQAKQNRFHAQRKAKSGR